MSQSSFATDRKNEGMEATEIANFEEFLSKLTQFDQSVISIVLLSSDQSELEQVYPKFEELVAPYATIGDLYYYNLQENESQGDRPEYRKLPAIVIYSGPRKLKLLAGLNNWSSLGNILKKVQKDFVGGDQYEEVVELGGRNTLSQSISTQSRHGNSGVKANSAAKTEELQRTAIYLFEELLGKGHISEKEFYFLKCQVLEEEKEFLTQINSHLR